MLAVWELHDPGIIDFDPALSRGLGLPSWGNHLALDAAHALTWMRVGSAGLRFGLDVLEIDHNWTVSVYTDDPNGNMIEWCHTVKEFGQAEAERALELLVDPAPPA